jgi:hypothetical protein
MGILEKILLSIRADTKQAQRAMGALGKSIDGIAVGFAKFGLAVQGVETALNAVKGAFDFAKEGATFQRNLKVIGEGALGRFEAAAKGGLDQATLLEERMKSMSGTMKLNNAQFETAVKFADEMSQRGFGPMNEILKQTVDRLKKGGEGMDDFGIELDKVTKGEDSKAGRSVKILAEMNKILQNPVERDGLVDGLDAVEAGFKNLSTTLSSTFASALKKVMPLIKDIGGGINALVEDLFSLNAVDRSGDLSERKAAQQILATISGTVGTQEGGMFQTPGGVSFMSLEKGVREGLQGAVRQSLSTGISFGDAVQKNLSDEEIAAVWPLLKRVERRFLLSKAGMRKMENEIGSVLDAAGPNEKDVKGIKGGKGGGGGGKLGGLSPDDLAVGAIGFGQTADDIRDQRGDGAKFTINMFEKVADAAVTQFNRMTNAGAMFRDTNREIVDALGFQRDAWGALGSVVGAAVGDMIEGQFSLRGTILGTIKEVLKGLAIEYSVKSVGMLAEGFALSSVGSPLAEAAFTSAKEFGVAAALAGAGAATVGAVAGSGGSGSRGRGAATGGPVGAGVPSPGGGRGGGETINVYVGQGFIGRPEELGREIKEAVRASDRAGNSRDRRAVRFR